VNGLVALVAGILPWKVRRRPFMGIWPDEFLRKKGIILTLSPF